MRREIKGVLMEADDKHPYPYTKYDCTAEEHMEQIGAISLEDFIQKISNKYEV